MPTCVSAAAPLAGLHAPRATSLRFPTVSHDRFHDAFRAAPQSPWFTADAPDGHNARAGFTLAPGQAPRWRMAGPRVAGRSEGDTP